MMGTDGKRGDNSFMTQLSVRASELHEQAVADFKVSERFAYSFIMKVKQIRDERLYKELGHDSFDSYCEKAWNTKRDFMDERIFIAESLENEKEFAGTYRQLGHSKSLLLARMEPTVREQIEQNNDLSELTVRQLKEMEKKLREAQQQAKQSETAHQKQQEKLLKQIEDLKKSKTSDNPETLKRIRELEQQLRSRSNMLQKTEQELENLKLRDTSQYDDEEAKKQLDKLRFEAERKTLDIRVALKLFNEKVAVSRHLGAAISASSDYEKMKFREELQITENIINDIKLALSGRLEIN